VGGLSLQHSLKESKAISGSSEGPKQDINFKSKSHKPHPKNPTKKDGQSGSTKHGELKKPATKKPAAKPTPLQVPSSCDNPLHFPSWISAILNASLSESSLPQPKYQFPKKRVVEITADLTEFIQLLQNEYPLMSASEVLTISGTPRHAYANTAARYMTWAWPATGTAFLEWLSGFRTLFEDPGPRRCHCFRYPCLEGTFSY